MTQFDGQNQSSEDRYFEAVQLANIPTLLLVLTQLTGDTRWIEDPYKPRRKGGLGDNDTGGFEPEMQAQIRSAALKAILEWNESGTLALTQPSDELLVEMLTVAMDETVPPEYGPFLRTELIDAGIAEALEVVPSPAVKDTRQAVIIGAGISGLCMAMALDREGINYKIIERHDSVGGVWFENTYPGAGVDTPNHLYSFSAIPNDWAYYFSSQDQILDYLRKVAKERGILSHIQFNTSVERAEFDEIKREWNVSVLGAEGEARTIQADLLFSAVGGFNNPKLPDIEGLETFSGPMFHTGQWQSDVDLDGKRVALLGNGASAVQTVPNIVDRVGHLTIFQRSPQWIAPFEKFRTPVPEPVRFLLSEMPLYRWWYRQRLNWGFNDRFHAMLRRDFDWLDQERSISKVNDGHRQYFTQYLLSELEGRPDLIEKSLPDYPPYGKRMLLDNGWYRSILQDHVDLVTDGVVKVEGNSITVASGDSYEADVLIMATGFDVVRFLGSYEVLGRGGRNLRDEWDQDDARAYLGTAIPGFPNLFMLYGPNTQAGHGGSVIANIEAQVHYVIGVVRQMREQNVEVVECRRDVYDAYNERIDREHESMIWSHQGMSTYYRNSKGRVVVPIPFRNIEYWQMTRNVDLGEYEILKSS